MKRLILFLGFFWPIAVHAQNVPVRMIPLGCEQLTSISSAVPLSSIPASANAVLLTAEAQAVRYRDDGVAPTSSVGILLSVGTSPFLYTGTLSAIQFIQSTSGSVLDACFYKIAG